MQSFHHPIHGLGYGKTQDVVTKTRVVEEEEVLVPIESGLTKRPMIPAPVKTSALTLKSLTTPLAMAIGYARSREAGDGQLKSIGLAFLLGIVSTPYLMYVAYDTYTHKK